MAAITRLTEVGILVAVAVIAYADIVLAAPGTPRGFLYVVLFPFLTDLPRLRGRIIEFGLICAALAAVAPVWKWTPGTLESIVENRLIMLFAIGSLAHFSRRVVIAEDRTLRVERRSAELEARLDQLAAAGRAALRERH